jgi:hypothetical protein
MITKRMINKVLRSKRCSVHGKTEKAKRRAEKVAVQRAY